MIGLEDLALPVAPVGGGEIGVAGDRRAVAHRHDGLRIAGLPVAVDDQTRIGLEHIGRVESFGEMRGHAVDTDIPGDMAGEIRFGDTERAERLREGAARMVGDEKNG